MKDLYSQLMDRLQRFDSPVTLIAIGRSALSFYDVPEVYTRDLDFEHAPADDHLYEAIKLAVKDLGVEANFSGDIDRWAIVPMPLGYKSRATMVMERGSVRVCILDPIDYAISKLRRGTVDDQRDARVVMAKFGVSRAEFDARIKLIPRAVDPEMHLFHRRVAAFLADYDQE